MNTSIKSLLVRSVLACFPLILCLGCVPGVVWLPDSSGFIYTTGDGDSMDVQHYDVAKGTQRVVVASTGTKTYWPGLSPDGKRVAIARLVRDPGMAESLLIVVYDMNGKELHRSPELPWRDPIVTDKKERTLLQTGVFWSPRDDRLVVHDYGDHAKAKTGIYDLSNHRLTLLEGHPAVFNNTPIRPDGSGFLLVKSGDNDTVSMTLVDWNGKEQKVDLQAGTADDDDKKMMLSFPYLHGSRWENANAVVTLSSTRIVIDTQQLTGTLHPHDPGAAVPEGKTLNQQFAFSEGGARIRILQWEEHDSDNNKRTYDRVEILKSGEAKPVVLCEKGVFTVLAPAPNQRLAAVRYWPEKGKEGIAVVNGRGEVVGRVTGE